MAFAEAGYESFFAISARNFQACPNTSERAQMHPSVSERIRTGPGRSEKLRKPEKIWENFEIFAKKLKKVSRSRLSPPKQKFLKYKVAFMTFAQTPSTSNRGDTELALMKHWENRRGCDQSAEK